MYLVEEGKDRKKLLEEFGMEESECLVEEVCFASCLGSV